MKAKVKKHTRVRKNGATVVRQHLRKKKKGSKRGKSGRKIGDFIQDRKVNAIIKANMNNKGPMHVKTRSHLLDHKNKDGQHLMKTHPNYKKPSTHKKKYSSKRKRK